MKTILASLIAIVVMLPPTATAQTSDIDDRSAEIIDACVDAMGTEMRLNSIDTLSLQGTTRVVMHEESGEEIVIVVSGDDQFHMSQSQGEVFTTFSGEQGWTGMEGQPPQRLNWAHLDVVREFLPLPRVAASWTSFSGTVRFVGASEVDSRPAWRLEFTTPNEITLIRDFDRESKLLVRQKFADAVCVFEYVTIDDVAILSKMEILEGPGTGPGEVYQTFEFDEINVNDPVAEDLFHVPDDLQKVADDGEPKSDK